MALVVFGVKKATLGIDEVLEKCPSCEADTFTDVFLTGDYYHIYYIPIFPIGKEISFFCQKCGLRRHNIPLNKETTKSYNDLNRKYKHPWYSYFFILFFGSLVLLAIILSLLPKQ